MYRLFSAIYSKMVLNKDTLKTGKTQAEQMKVYYAQEKHKKYKRSNHLGGVETVL